MAGIELKYNTYRENGGIKVDEQGQARVAYSPTSEDNSSLYQYHNFYVRASQPEAGEITAESGLLVFPNDVQIGYTQQVEDDQATLGLRLNEVELDRYNRGEEDSLDSLLGKPVAGRVITGSITELPGAGQPTLHLPVPGKIYPEHFCQGYIFRRQGIPGSL